VLITLSGTAERIRAGTIYVVVALLSSVIFLIAIALTYAAAGTENRTYAMGCAVGKSPLGPFVPQKNNPILRSTTGLVTGTAHGCVVEGPHKSLWAFYTVKAAVVHGFERRLGMDPASIGADGELRVDGASSLPRRLP